MQPIDSSTLQVWLTVDAYLLSRQPLAAKALAGFFPVFREEADILVLLKPGAAPADLAAAAVHGGMLVKLLAGLGVKDLAGVRFDTFTPHHPAPRRSWGKIRRPSRKLCVLQNESEDKTGEGEKVLFKKLTIKPGLPLEAFLALNEWPMQRLLEVNPNQVSAQIQAQLMEHPGWTLVSQLLKTATREDIHRLFAYAIRCLINNPRRPAAGGVYDRLSQLAPADLIALLDCAASGQKVSHPLWQESGLNKLSVQRVIQLCHILGFRN